MDRVRDARRALERVGKRMKNRKNRTKGQFVAVQMFRLFASLQSDKRRAFRILMTEFKRGQRPPVKDRSYEKKRKRGPP